MATSYLLLCESRKNIIFNIVVRNYSNFSKKNDFAKCYKILNISEDSNQEQIRQAYLVLVKRFHPDSGTEEADSDKFHEIDKAFKILINKKALERGKVEDECIEERERHIVPQHRQYLSYEGIGMGTQFQRQKQYSTIRAMRAAENVLQHRISKVSAEENAVLNKATAVKHKIKTKYGFDRLVEDLIQESMSKGQFQNLSGCGKPLKNQQNRNPYVDFVTHKLNEVLIDNGFTPEWIQLHKEIRENLEQLRNSLASERAYFGVYPLEYSKMMEWDSIISKYEELSNQINKKIDKFNLVVPIMDKQMVRIDLKKEAEKVLIHGESNTKLQNKTIESVTEKSHKSANMFDIIEQLFNRNK